MQTRLYKTFLFTFVIQFVTVMSFNELPRYGVIQAVHNSSLQYYGWFLDYYAGNSRSAEGIVDILAQPFKFISFTRYPWRQVT